MGTGTPIIFGTVNGSPIESDARQCDYGHQELEIVLTAAYTMEQTQPDQIARPFQTGALTSVVGLLPHTFSIGTTLTLHSPEAYALINAGAANFVANEN